MTHIESLDDRTHFDAGAVDTHFGTGGLTRITVPYAGGKNEGTLAPRLMAVDAAGRTIIGSVTATTLVFRRIDAFGTEDAAFAASPLARPIAYGGSLTGKNRIDLAVDATNRIYLLNNATVTRYTSSGKIDRSFGKSGSVKLTVLKEAADLDVGADGHVWVVGSTGKGNVAGNQMRVVRLTADGAFDSKFASNGVYTAHVPALGKRSFDGGAEGMAVRGRADGSVVFAGQGQFRERNPSDDSVVHYAAVEAVSLTAKGTLDLGYGSRGVAVDSLLTDDVVWSYPTVIGIRSNGTVVTGDSYETDSPNPPYGGLSTLTVSPTGIVGYVQNSGISTTTPGTFLPAAGGGDYFVNANGLIKLNADGTADTAFNGGVTLPIVTAAAVGNNGGLVFAGTGSNSSDNHYNVGRFYTREGPSGILIPTTLTGASKVLTFSVVWQDDVGVNPADLTGAELRVSGPGYHKSPTLVSTSTAADGSVTAMYAMRLAGGRKWSAANNGVFSVAQNGALPRDTADNPGAGGTIGSVVVRIA